MWHLGKCPVAAPPFHRLQYLLCMTRLVLFLSILGCLTPLAAQSRAGAGQYAEVPPPFEVYGLASGLKTVDATPTLVITNPGSNQPLGFAPNGLASGVSTGFVWRYENIGLMADFGYHRYSDHTGSTSMAPLMLGLRLYSNEHYRTSFFCEGLAGAYRWNVNSGNLRFTAGKGIVMAGGGLDVRLTRRLVWRVLELRLGIAGARINPLLTGGPSTGIAYRFGDR